MTDALSWSLFLHAAWPLLLLWLMCVLLWIGPDGMDTIAGVFKRPLALLGLIELAWTEDSSGEVRLRRVRTTPFGKRIVHGYSSMSTAELLPDGSANGACLRRWKRWRVNDNCSS
jgi:hypothetical protein